MDLKELNNLDVSDLNNMGSWPLAAKGIVCAIVFAIVIAVAYWMFISDQKDLLVTTERKEFDLKKEYEKKQAKAVNLEDYKRQMGKIKETFETLLQQLPKSDELPALVDEISYAATGAGCEWGEIKFFEEKQLDFYAEKAMEIQVSGGYHQLADFVSRISRSSRIVTLHDFNIAFGEGEVASSPGEKMLTMTIMAKTYRSDSDTEVEQ